MDLAGLFGELRADVVEVVLDLTAEFVQGAALGIPIVMLLCSFAMVTSIPYVHVFNRYVSGPRSFKYVARLVFIVALASWWFQETLAVLFTAYALSGPISELRGRLRRPRGAGARNREKTAV